MYSNCYSCQILMKLEFLNRLLKNIQKTNFITMCLVEAESFHADGWMDGQMIQQDEANNGCLQFCEHA